MLFISRIERVLEDLLGVRRQAVPDWRRQIIDTEVLNNLSLTFHDPEFFWLYELLVAQESQFSFSFSSRSSHLCNAHAQ